ncbi:MAG TPA: hypothetical protein VIR63_06490 [Pontiella sp.]
MNKFLLISLFTAALTVSASESTFHLAKELLDEGSYTLSAIEFRRFAMESEQRADQAGAYLFSSYAYLQNQDGRSSAEMNDRAEQADRDSVYINEHSLLSAESARIQNDTASALYFYDALAADSESADFQTFARRRSAAIHLSNLDFKAARSALELSPSDETLALEALETYMNGSDKSPKIGGLWGLIPGAGYWYSGEIANGFRSLILNSLFIYGMAHTAEEDQWGAFSIITFFEITWYSGSIYGGIDSAQRYNQERLHTALDAIEGDLSYQPKPDMVVPVFKLKIHF